MEIQKIFSSWNEDERLYSVLMDEGEMYLFSDYLEQREFNSKAQKLLRRKWDIQQGLKGLNTRTNASEFELLRRGRTGEYRLKPEGNVYFDPYNLNLNQRINTMARSKMDQYDRTNFSKYYTKKSSKYFKQEHADHGYNLGEYGISDYKDLIPSKRRKEALERIAKRK